MPGVRTPPFAHLVGSNFTLAKNAENSFFVFVFVCFFFGGGTLSMELQLAEPKKFVRSGFL